VECLEWSARTFIYRGRKGYEFEVVLGKDLCRKRNVILGQKIGKKGAGIKEKRKGKFGRNCRADLGMCFGSENRQERM